jgi:hypothetical protein
MFSFSEGFPSNADKNISFYVPRAFVAQITKPTSNSLPRRTHYQCNLFSFVFFLSFSRNLLNYSSNTRSMIIILFAACFMMLSCLASTLKMETCSYRMSANFQRIHGVISQKIELFIKFHSYFWQGHASTDNFRNYMNRRSGLFSNLLFSFSFWEFSISYRSFYFDRHPVTEEPEKCFNKLRAWFNSD